MTEQYIKANGVRLAYDDFGDSSLPAIVLIMGLGTQMIAWPEEFCLGLADSGFRVIRFDNRDIGLSEKMGSSEVSGLLLNMLLSRLKLPVKAPYKLHDMAEDVVGLLDALDIEAAHLVGASMGGMIAQMVAGNFPYRTLTLTSIMSSSGARSLPGPRREVMAQMLRRPKGGQQEYLAHAMRTWRLIGSPDYLPSDEVLREKIIKSYRRSYYPAGFARQAAAIAASGPRVDVLQKIQAPTLVIHGKADALVPVECGIDTARHIPGARLELIDGMGHDLPQPLLARFVQLITAHATAHAADLAEPTRVRSGTD